MKSHGCQNISQSIRDISFLLFLVKKKLVETRIHIKRSRTCIYHEKSAVQLEIFYAFHQGAFHQGATHMSRISMFCNIHQGVAHTM